MVRAAKWLVDTNLSMLKEIVGEPGSDKRRQLVVMGEADNVDCGETNWSAVS